MTALRTGSDPLADELRRRRQAAIDTARRYVESGQVDNLADGATIFGQLYAAQQCDKYLTLLERLAVTA